MGTRYYHGSGNHRTSNGTGVEMLRMFGLVFAFVFMLTLAGLVLLAGDIAWVVTWGKWSGARTILHIGTSIAKAAFRSNTYTP